jgi:hypothetical protein
MSTESDTEQERAWADMYERIVSVMGQFGTEDHLGKADYLIVDDNYGWRRNTVEIHRLQMLQPVIVRLLQRLLGDVPNWEIIVAVDIPGTENNWPRMGLTIRQHEIVDELQRQYFPKEFQALKYV